MLGPKGFVGALFALVGALFTALPVWQLAAIQIDRATGTTVTGVVVEARRGGGSRAGYRPIARFTDEQGRHREAEGWVGLRRSLNGTPRTTHAIGTKVAISYPRGRPEDARFSDAKSQIWLALTAAFGALFVALGVWLVRHERREMRDDGWNR